MSKILEYLKLMVTAHSGFSSKRVCGVLGFIVVIIVLLYCTFMEIEAPVMIETFIYAICALLGIDSVTSIFKKNNENNQVSKR